MMRPKQIMSGQALLCSSEGVVSTVRRMSQCIDPSHEVDGEESQRQRVYRGGVYVSHSHPIATLPNNEAKPLFVLAEISESEGAHTVGEAKTVGCYRSHGL